jgi:pyruvate-formate lyase-activating enzyme
VDSYLAKGATWKNFETTEGLQKLQVFLHGCNFKCVQKYGAEIRKIREERWMPRASN